jgi:hypothetical protein
VRGGGVLSALTFKEYAMTVRLVRSALLVAALGAALAGCVVAPVAPVAPAPGYGYGYGGEVVGVAPPPPQVEYMGPPPAVGYVWIGGYWGWHGGRHVWNAGHWEAPRAGYHWVPHAWVREGNGWRLHDGHWARG